MKDNHFYLNQEEKNTLKNIARQSIEYGLKYQSPLTVDINKLQSKQLKEKGASFVTLKLNNQLRGCIGSIEPQLPLAQDIANNAFAAAFLDNRFPPLTKKEFSNDTFNITISILTPLIEIPYNGSENDLINKINKGDGLLLQFTPTQKAVFLPIMWGKIPNKQDFINNLKLKAGVPLDFWTPTIKAYKFSSSSI